MKNQKNDSIEVIDIRIIRRFLDAEPKIEETRKNDDNLATNKLKSNLDGGRYSTAGNARTSLKRNSSLSRNCIYLRQKAGLTLGDLALKTGVNPGTLSCYERGTKKSITISNLGKIADFYKTTSEKLLNGSYE